MKSLAELETIRKQTYDIIKMRKVQPDTKVVVGMGTCGIAAGARKVLSAFMDEVVKQGFYDVTLAQSGCDGTCDLEPIVEVCKAGMDKVTYVKVTPEMVSRIVTEHLMGGKVVSEFTKEHYESQNK